MVRRRAAESEAAGTDEGEYGGPSVKKSSPNKPKRKRTSEPQERRGARYLSTPNAAVRERISRAFAHRLYLIDKRPHRSSHQQKNSDADADADVKAQSCDFFVLGATGNVYTVNLDLRPSCTCPDHAKGNTCKHILFVMLRVLKLERDDPRVWQKALLPSELQSLMENLSINDAVLASSVVRQRFHQMSGQSDEQHAHQRPVEGDCPVCYEPMACGHKAEPVVFCNSCGNNVHKDCFNRWSKSKKNGPVTCIYCRAVWDTPSHPKKQGRGDYINLASYSGVHGPEETSVDALYPDTYQWWSRRRS